MTYQEFNRKIFHFYQARSTSSFCLLIITRSEIENIIPVSELRRFRELRYSWNRLLDSKDGLPQYFGLIAIQCYAASQMRRDELNAEDAYKVRLCEVLGLPDNPTLHQFFKGDDPARPVQEQIWFAAQAYLKRYFQQELDLPERTTGAWRYVRYPKSQALLNLEDLRYFTPFFASEFYPGEMVPYQFFHQRLQASLLNLALTSRAFDLINDYSKRPKCFQQIYEYFNSWDGTVYVVSRKGLTTDASRSITASALQTVLLLFEDGQPRFYLADATNTNINNEVSFKALFRGAPVARYHKGLFLFTETEYYPNEYESSRFLSGAGQCYFLLDRSFSHQEYRLLERNHLERFDLDGKRLLYRCQCERDDPFFKRFVQVKTLVGLDGGIRVSRRREYLQGYGPDIACRLPFRVIADYQAIEYQPNLAPSGVYRVRVDGFRDFEFWIVETVSLVEKIASKNKGWSLQRYESCEDFEMEGLSVNLPTLVANERSRIRAWIKVNLQKQILKRPFHQALPRAINNTRL